MLCLYCLVLAAAHFTNTETQAERISELLKAAQLGRGRGGCLHVAPKHLAPCLGQGGARDDYYYRGNTIWLSKGSILQPVYVTSYRKLKFSIPCVLICKVGTKCPFHREPQRLSDLMHVKCLEEYLANNQCSTT